MILSHMQLLLIDVLNETQQDISIPTIVFVNIVSYLPNSPPLGNLRISYLSKFNNMLNFEN